jgi:hypothetical protein
MPMAAPKPSRYQLAAMRMPIGYTPASRKPTAKRDASKAAHAPVGKNAATALATAPAAAHTRNRRVGR